MTRNPLICAIGLLAAAVVTIHGQIGPIRVESGTTQVVARVAQGKVDIKQQGMHGTAASRPDPTGGGKSEIAYTAQQLKDPTSDSFTYVVDTGAEQAITVQIEPPVFDLDRQVYEKIFKAIFLLFILAVVLESGLALIFNWRPFVETFNSRATKPLVSFVFAYLFVSQFALDLMASILAAASSQAPPPSLPGRIITALVLAGGSAGINNILIALGFRQQRTPETVTPKPPPTKAWIAFRLARLESEGPVEVFLGPTPPVLPGVLPLAGLIPGTSRSGFRFFFRDPGRFPAFAGHVVAPGVPLSFELVGRKKGDNQTAVSVRRDNLIVDAGAIIDLEVRL